MATRRLPLRRGLLAVALLGMVGMTGCARPAAGSAAAPSVPGATVAERAIPASPAAAPASAPAATAAEGAAAVPLAACTSGTAATRTAGALTVATGPAAAPWVVGDPAGGQGVEAAVALALARGLGYDAAHTRWVTADRAAVLAGDTASFDVALDRFSVVDTASAPVDVSSGYFADADAVLVPSGSPPATLSALAGRRLVELPAAGSSDSVQEDGELTAGGTVPDATAGVAALADGTVDGVLLPLTDALAAAAADPGVSVLGQLRTASAQPDQLVAVLAAQSTLTPCVSAVLDRMRVEGTLDQLAETWVPVPVLR